MRRKAIAYTSDIILGRTGEVISRPYQRELIRQFAEENGIEVVAWFEDEIYDEDVLMRPGIQKMLAYDGPYEAFLVERAWALSRKTTTLEAFFRVLDRKNVKLECATYMWDCTSQMVRRRFAPKLATLNMRTPVAAGQKPKKVAIRKPEKLHFVGWAIHPQRA